MSFHKGLWYTEADSRADKTVTMTLCDLKHKFESCQKLIIIDASIRVDANMLEHLEESHTRKCFSNAKPNQSSLSILARNHKKIIFHSCQDSKTTATPKHPHNRTFVLCEALEEMPQGIMSRPLIWLFWHSWLISSQF